MQVVSDNAARVHPAVWKALQAADAPDAPYDGDRLSGRLDEAFSALFGRRCAVLWAATGTAANCLALAAMVEPHRGVICHRSAHIENDEGGAPGFFLHGAKLMLVDGEQAMFGPDAIDSLLGAIRRDVHRTWPQAVSVTQSSELGGVYAPEAVAAVAACAKRHELRLHVDGARFANAVAHLGCAPAAACGGADTLAFGMVKNGAMNAEAVVFFDPALADVARFRRKRAGHLQSKGRFAAAQLLAMIADDLWLRNARASNAAASEVASAAARRLLHPVQANEVFLHAAPDERAALRAAGFGFYDWGDDAIRIVTAWDSRAEDVAALARAIAAL